MGQKKPVAFSAVSDILDGIADLIDQQDFTAALAKIEKSERDFPTRLSPIDIGRIHLYAAEALFRTADYKNGSSRASRAISCFKHTDAHKMYGRAKYVRALTFLEQGNVIHAIDDFSESIFAFRRIDDAEGEILSCNWAAKCSFMQGQYEQARKYLERSLQLATMTGDHTKQKGVRSNLGRISTLLGDFVAAKPDLAINPALVSSIPRLNLCNRYISLAYLLILTRDFDEGRLNLKRAHDIAVENSFVREMSIYHEYAGELAFWKNDYNSAETHYREAIKIGMEIAPEGDLISQSYRLLAELQVEQQKLDAAEESCNRAWKVAEKITERLELGAIQRVRGHIYSLRDNPEAARQAFGESYKILGEIGAKYELARAHLTAGEAEVFDDRERLINLFTARGLFDRVGVAWWQKRVTTQIEKLVRGNNSTNPPAIILNGGTKKAKELIASSAPMRKLLADIEKVKNTDMTLLLLGETGVGKDHLALYIHQHSNRADLPFESVCTVNIPDHLWESELFGHQKGSFTGADADKTGILERADGGTVYLNEISELPLGLQARMLDFLETKQIRRLGDSQNRKLDIRFMAASNRDLKKEIAAGRFREDLFFRLNQMPVIIPPLRERRSDIGRLAAHFLNISAFSANMTRQLLEHPFREELEGASWPGNVRQLEHIMRRLVVLTNGADVAEMIEIGREIMAAEGLSADAEREQLIVRLTANDWNQRQTARVMGISESSLRRLMKQLKISRPSDG